MNSRPIFNSRPPMSLPSRPAFTPRMELAPIVSRFDDGAVFKGVGSSHFTAAKGLFHLTENLGSGFKTRINFDENGNVSDD